VPLLAAPSPELVFGSAREGAALLEGWSDEGTWKILLPWPEETRELSPAHAASWVDFIRALETDEPAYDPMPEAPFLGGWVGFLTYETAATTEDAVVRPHLPPEPPAFFALHRAGILIDPRGNATLFAPAERLDHYSALSGRLDPIIDRPVAKSAIEDSLADGAFARAVDEIRQSIAAGDVYQVNLTRRFSAAARVSPVALYRALSSIPPPRSSAFIRGGGWTIVSASPEVLLSHDRRSGVAESRPIKGTVRRHGNDAAEIAALLGSAKDASEHLMIVDLVRNDLGKVAPAGGVTVPHYRTVQTLEHVHHLESTVRAEGLGNVAAAEVLQAISPAGSITGAPKRSAVRIIGELEPVPRGVYCGSIGFIDARGRTEMSVAIRTAVVTPDEVRYHAGGGIVWDSTAEAEHEECLAKSSAFLSFFGKDPVR
jgi:anthranilate/para-aminobenzoate synthase component I